jgi:3,4-dihydroxy 2-butanone 4-phosphate synthase/GTP cyclohydrolase II
MPDLLEFGNQHEIKIGTIADLIKHRLQNEATVKRSTETTINTRFGEFDAVIYDDVVSGNSHLALVRGPIERERPTLVRVHLHYGLYDVLAEARGDHTWPVNDALEAVAKQDSGVVVLLDYNEGEETLLSHIHDSQRQDEHDTPDNASSGDLRVLGAGSQILADLGVGKMRVLGTPRKAHALSGFELEIVDYISDKLDM